MSSARSILGFPNPVNEPASRVVAGCVAVIALAAILAGLPWLSAALAYGFLARVLTGPALSPLGQLATRVVAPRLTRNPKLVAGPPKRFAQAIGATLTVAAAGTWFGLHLALATDILLGILVVAATLESVFAVCLGCRVFAVLIRLGLIPEEVCLACADIWSPEARALRAKSAGS